MRLTDAQVHALSTIVAAWDKVSADNQARWGMPLRGGISILRGKVNPYNDLTFDMRSIKALADGGLIDLERRFHRSDSLRRGAYGRWIGGTTDRSYTSMLAKPTELGRAYLKGRE